MTLDEPPSAETDFYLTVDGTELSNRENVTEYGTHRFEAYVCYNPTAGDCDSATTTASSQSQSTRTHAGPTKRQPWG